MKVFQEVRQFDRNTYTILTSLGDDPYARHFEDITEEDLAEKISYITKNEWQQDKPFKPTEALSWSCTPKGPPRKKDIYTSQIYQNTNNLPVSLQALVTRA